MERNELMDDLRSLVQLVPIEQGRTIDAAIKELDSDVTQVLRLEAVIRVIKGDAGALVAAIDKQQKEIDDLKSARDGLWEHLRRAWGLGHAQQRKLNHARFEAKGYKCAAEDEKTRGNFFLKQLRKFGMGYHNVDYDGDQPGSSREVARSLKVVSRDTSPTARSKEPAMPDMAASQMPRDTIHPNFVPGYLRRCPHGKLWRKTGKPRDHQELDCVKCPVNQRDAVHTLRRQTAGGECPHGQAWDDCPDCRH